MAMTLEEEAELKARVTQVEKDVRDIVYKLGETFQLIEKLALVLELIQMEVYKDKR